jgi:hypothetical protein
MHSCELVRNISALGRGAVDARSRRVLGVRNLIAHCPNYARGYERYNAEVEVLSFVRWAAFVNVRY